MRASQPSTRPRLPRSLREQVERAGFYPALVGDVVADALAEEEVLDHLVHQETTFDRDEVRRHVTVLVLTPTRLLVAHADDHGPDDSSPEPYATASTEAVALGSVRSVVLSSVVADPARYRTGDAPREVTLAMTWGAVQRLDLEPAACSDPQCEADHGYTGTATAEDIAVRVSAEAEGVGAVADAVRFARALTAATGPSARR